MKRTIFAVLLFLLLGWLFIFSPGFATQGKQNSPRTIGSVVTVYSRQEEIPLECAAIDYIHNGPVHGGWPFTVSEELHDKCGAFFANPNNYLKVYPGGVVINTLFAALITFVVIIVTKKLKAGKKV